MINDYQHLTERFEGFRQKPYKDSVGKLTIGYGFNLDDVGLSKSESKMILSKRLTDIHKKLSKELDFFNSLSEIRQYVLVDMCYNLGFAGLMKFTKMLDAIRQNNFTEASQEMRNSRWATQVGQRADILEHMMKTDQISPYRI